MEGQAKIHELKIWPKHFKEVESDEKTFESRKNDRDYKVGDFLCLREYDPKTEEYSGAFCLRKVTHILDELPFVPLGYVIMSIKPIQEG